MSDGSHAIFAKSPLNGTVQLSTGSLPMPYHVYEGHGLILLGYGSASALAPVFVAQDVHPVLTHSGQVVMVVFICDFSRASHGAHNELHITALVAPQPGQTLPDDPAAALAALALRPDWGVLSLHLWNDTTEVVAYNSEYLGLQAMRCVGAVGVQKDKVTFDLKGTDGSSLAVGQVRRKARSDPGLMLRVVRRLGWRGMWQAMKRQPATAHVINRKCDTFPRNGRALTQTAPDTMIVTAFDPAQDQLDITQGPLAACGFAPKIIEHLSPFRFVYLHPDAS